MAPASAAVVFLAAAAVAVMAMEVQLRAAAAAGAVEPPLPGPLGLPNCSTRCGDVIVPYPFGFGHPGCYWPGLDLTCDTRHHPPRLLLGDGSLGLRVAEISVRNQTVRVMRAGYIINTTSDFVTSSDGWNASFDFGRGFKERGYRLSAQNELAISGCNVMATISAEIVSDGEEATKIVSGCASFCTMSVRDPSFINQHLLDDAPRKYCTGTSGCCVAPLSASGVPVPNGVHARLLYGGNHTIEQTVEPVIVFVAEKGWAEKEFEQTDGLLEDFGEAPLLLDFGVKQGLPQLQPNNGELMECSQDVHRMVCKSEHSDCTAEVQGYTCKCKGGYDGNPYLAGGCQDFDECMFGACLFGVCTNTIGSFQCRCPQGTYGDPSAQGGCIDDNFNKDADTGWPTVVPVPTTAGMPNCSTSCGKVSVPYPFGFGHPDCYLPGLNLTCDTSHGPPRLLLDGNGTLQVVHISLRNSTVRVIHHSSVNWTTDVDQTPSYDVRLPDIGKPYVLSSRNELIVISMQDVRATLHGVGETRNVSSNSNTDNTISQAVCSSVGDDAGIQTQTHPGYCSGYDGCCHASISAGSKPKRMEFKQLNRNISNHYIHNSSWKNFALVFISEEGLIGQWHKIFNMDDFAISSMSSPIVLQWTVKQGFPEPAADKSAKCRRDVVRRLCRSEHSNCRQANGGFTCHCSKGYYGNPYVADGCQDIDECKIPTIRNSCLGGICNNLAGDHECLCPPGTHGNAYRLEGCVPTTPKVSGLTIGLLAASGPTLLILLVLVLLFLQRKFKQHQIKVQKQKYFKQNRGQLLQQLVSQKADIAERMIIPWDELAKATNNFDRAREIGGGGHGTVYKGILSDLHVVAIKKSKITMQKEIDEFINEVAILSQINHKNVVKLFGCCLETEVPLLVYEFIPNGTLYHHLHIEGQERSLSWSCRLRIATEISTSLAYLHSSVSIPIIHRDIKSSNILLDDTMTSKISDFGASRYIPIDNTGLTTRIQGTFRYLDPECFHTGRLTEKSDVYSFGVILVELLTRRKPTCSQLSSEYGGLVPHFLNLLSSRNLVQIMDPQVLEEGGSEVQQVVMLAASCINIRGEERPTMRQVEHTLEGLQQGSNRMYKKDDIVTEEFENGSLGENYRSWTSEGQKFEESSRRFSLEQEMMMSARYPR